MARAIKWLAIAGAAGVLLLAVVVLALHRWLGTDDFRQRVEREASAAAGLPVKVGALSIDLFPLPAVAVDQLRIDSKPPLTLERVEARPRWQPLLQGRLEVATLVVRQAVLPQPAIAAIVASVQKQRASPMKPAAAAQPQADSLAWLPRRAVLQRVTWADEKGARTTFDAQLRLDDSGLLESGSFKVLEGRLAGTQGQVEREADHWPVRIDIGGGRITGRLTLQPGKAGTRVLGGTLATEGVELAALTAPSKTLSGKLQAQTTLNAQFRDPGEIADAMQTQTRFTVRHAVLHGIDLAQAVTTVGIHRSGETRLDTLAGHLATHGRAAQLTNLVASSGALAATGNVAMAASKNLSGRVAVELASAKGTVGVPLQVGGTLDSPSVTLSRGALVGAAVGTLLAPGVGTGAGASAGDKLGNSLKGLFGR
ncbi:MAG: AsmA family protein [Burkholderiales bacterium]|nr:AsmA family protein [Burkholderiales bacterium]